MIFLRYKNKLIDNKYRIDPIEQDYKLVYKDSKLEFYNFGITKLFDKSIFDDHLAVIDGYCFDENNLLNAADLIKIYLKNGTSHFKKFSGSYNLIIYKISEEKLIIVPDEFASRMLFYNNNSNCLLVCSRLNNLKKISNENIELNELATQEYFYFNFFIQNSKTLFNNIYIIPADKIFSYAENVINLIDFEIKQYDYSTSGTNDDDFSNIWVQAFDNLLKLFPNDLLSIPLSAGLDCRAILGELNRRKLNDRIRAITFSHPKSYEYKYAKQVTNSLNIEHELISWDQEDVYQFNNYYSNFINNDFMTFCYPYIPNHLYRELSVNSNNIWSGFSGDPLMGSHTLDLSYLTNNSRLLDICMQKYRTINKHEMGILNIDFNINEIRDEVEKTTTRYDNLNLIEGFDSWYMKNRNRYTTQCGISANRDLFEYIYPFLMISNYAYKSDIMGKYKRSSYMKNMKKLYSKAFGFPNSSDWTYKSKFITSSFSLINKMLSKYSVNLTNVAIRSYKFNYDYLLYGSQKHRKKLLNLIDSLNSENVVKSIDKLDKLIKERKIRHNFIDCVISYLNAANNLK